MRKNCHKKLLGVLGLTAVAAMTAVASTLPAPVSAVSVSDTITVTVVDSTPKATITNITEDEELGSYKFKVEYDYEHLTAADLYLVYYPSQARSRGADTVPVGHKDFDTTGLIAGASGSSAFNVDLSNYAASSHYMLYLSGTGVNSQAADDSRNVIYTPITPDESGIEYDQDSTTRDPILNFPNMYNADVDHIDIVVLDENGDPVQATDPTTGTTSDFVRSFNTPITDARLDFAASGIVKSGKYFFVIYAYNSNGSQIGAPVSIEYDFEAVPIPETPDTGSFLGSLNLAREDYAITGLIIFGGAILLTTLFLKKKNHRR